MFDALTPVDAAKIITFAQIALLVVSIPFSLSLSARAQSFLRMATWGSMGATIANAILFVLALASVIAADDPTAGRTIATWTLISLGVLVLQVVVRSFRGFKQRMDTAKLETPAVRSRAGEELRAILQNEGLEIDERLDAARDEREAFLYALEERHAAQIAGLAEEYQAEAHTILAQLLDQLAAEQLQPMVEQRLAEHKAELKNELGVLEQVAAGETLNSLRDELKELDVAIAAANDRVDEIRRDNPDSTIEERVQVRIDEISGEIERRGADIEQDLEKHLDERAAVVEQRIDEVAAQLDGKAELAGNPLQARLEAVQEDVDSRMRGYMDALERRFAETEKLLTDRTVDQERALEDRVTAMETGIDQRLDNHASSIDDVLGKHDDELQRAIEDQLAAVNRHFDDERRSLADEFNDRSRELRTEIRSDLSAAEENARASVETTHKAWDEFTGELETRFHETREHAIAEAQRIAEDERQTLIGAMESITTETQQHIAGQTEQLGREAAWQRAQLDRTVSENLGLLQTTAQEAMNNADVIFGDLERMGADRVESIRVRAEESLVQSRDYIVQLEESLTAHLDTMQAGAQTVATDLETRLNTLTETANQAGEQLETYAKTLVDTVTAELGRISDSKVDEMNGALATDLQQRMETAVADQHKQYEAHLTELATRTVQQVNGDVAGVVEHARSAVTSELENVMNGIREQSQTLQQQAHGQVMEEIAKQQQELATTANDAASRTRNMLEDAMRDSQRQLDEAMASMGAHMREELVRFQDEGRRRVEQSIEQLRGAEQDLLRDEDRRLNDARAQLVSQHRGQMQNEIANMVGNLGASLNTGGVAAEQPTQGGTGSMGSTVQRPQTPLGQPQGQDAGNAPLG